MNEASGWKAVDTGPPEFLRRSDSGERILRSSRSSQAGPILCFENQGEVLYCLRTAFATAALLTYD
jgi:hypothetical protein